MVVQHDDPRHRYELMLVTIMAISIAAGWAISVTSVDSGLLLAIPALALLVAGIAWDRIILQRNGLTVRR